MEKRKTGDQNPVKSEKFLPGIKESKNNYAGFIQFDFVKFDWFNK